LTRFKLFDWFHTLDDMLNDSEMNQAFDDYKRAEHIQEIFLAIIVLGVLSSIGVIYEYNEIATGCVGGIIALGMKVLESE